MPNPTIVSAALNDKDLRDSITRLVADYKNSLNDMKTATTNTVNDIKDIIASIGSTKVDFSGTLDGLEKAKKKMTTSASGGGTTTPAKDGYADNTIGALEESIRLEEKKRKEMELGTKELRDQNKLIEEQKNKLKGEKSSNTIAENAKKATKELGNAMSKSSATLSLAQDRLRALIDLQNKYRNSQDLSIKQQNRLTDAIEQTRKKIASFQKKATTTSGQPMGFWDVKNSMPEDSIEDIRNKMKALRQVKAQDAYESKLLADEYQRLKRKQNELMGSSIQLTKSNNYLAQSFGYIRNRIVYALTLGALTSFVKQIYEIRGQYEMLERSLGVLVNSFERGSQVFRELSEMALKSPFTLIELGTAAKQLTAYNFSANEVVDTTRRLADLSAALGVPTERLVYNLGQIRAQTRLTARDARDFANAGLPIVKNLADYYTNLEGKIVSTGDVYDRMTKKMVSYGDVMAVINQVTDEGGKFFDFQAKQANTLKVQMANLDLAWNNMLNDLGKSEQGLLTAPISALKTIFQSWKDINHIIWTLISAYGLLKVAQVVAITNEMKWAAAAGGTARAMDSIANAINGVIGKFGALVHNPWTWVFIGISALADLGVSWYQNTKAIREFNDEIRKAADESTSALSKMLDNKGNKATQKLASENKLTAEQGEKAWNAIKEEMETSVASSNRLIQELLKIDDINERVSKGFEYAEKINAANLALSEMSEDMIKITKSWGVFGVFGEGLADDLADLKEELHGIGGQVGIFDQQGMVNENLGSGFKEYRDELEVTANSIKNFLDAYNITDPLQMQEVLERVRSQIKAKNPEIQGELARLFDVTLDQRMNTLTNGAIDANTSLWKIFMDNLRRSSSSAFSDISDDIYNESTKLTKEQQDAVDKNLEYFKNTMPYYYDAVKSMVENASQLKIQIGLTFNVQQLTDFQKEVNKRIKEKYGEGIAADQFNALLPTNNDDLISFTKTQQEAIAKLQDDNKKYQKDRSDWAKKHVAENNTEIEQRKHLLDLFNQSYAKETKGGGKGKQRDIILDTIKEEISLTKKLQGEYDKLTSKGASHADAIKDVQDRYANTIKLLDIDLGKFGLPKFDTSIITGKDPNKQLEYFKKLRDLLQSKGLLNLDRSKVLDATIQELDVSAKTFNLDKITKGLNNELDRLKDEYELAVSLDADPELGNVFADMMGINIESLPHTVKEYADEYSKYLNKYLKGKNSALQFTGDELRSLTRDDITAFREQVDAGYFNQEWFDAILKAYEDISGKRKKDLEETEKWKNGLIEKYGNLQDKLTKIYKDSVQNQVNAVKTFGTEDQKSNIVRLQLRLEATDNPAELSEINTEIAKIVKDVIDKNPIALKLVTASNNQTKADTSKAYWEDFKNSELYAMTFEDMAKNSTRAIQLIIDKLNELKDKVKEDPASMKALIKSLEDAEKELNARDPFAGIVNSIKNWSAASKEAKVAQEELRNAEKAVEKAQSELDDAEDGTPEEQALAQKNLTDAIQRRGNAEVKVVQAENKVKKSQEQLNTSLTGLSNTLNEIGGLFGTVAKLFAAAGDDDTAEAINAISEGFSTMTTVIMGVVAAMKLLKATNPWLLAISAALGVIVGLVSFLSGNSNKKITKQVEESERAVKQLELAYVDLQQAVDKAYGTAVIGAKQAALANKELQLAEIQRQIQLEKSRKSKNRDEDKIIDLQKQYKELFYEIKNGYTEIVDDLMGTDVGSFAENLVSSMIEAFKQGEDYMKVFSDKFDEMIDNMIMKSIVSRVVSQYLDAIWEDVNKHINERTKEESEDAAKAQNEAVRRAGLSNDEARQEIASLRSNGLGEYLTALVTVTQRDIDDYKKAALDEEKAMQARLKAASAFTGSDVDYVMQRVTEIMPELGQKLKDILGEYYKFGESSETQLSALQQGIQGITEDTAGALEAYMNGVSQQVYLHSDLLTQIRDAVVGFNLDVQVATMSQILLQLQSSYSVQMAIQGILEGWSSPSGLAVRVEMQ